MYTPEDLTESKSLEISVVSSCLFNSVKSSADCLLKTDAEKAVEQWTAKMTAAHRSWLFILISAEYRLKPVEKK